MRLRQPRIAPLDLETLDSDQAEVLAPFRERGPVLNIFRTLARKPKALKGFLAWGNYVLSKRNSLPERERELAILRTGFNCKSGYEFTQHKRVGINCGLTEDEVERVKQGPDAPGWSELDSAILRAADELVSDHFVSDATWSALASLGDEGRMDLVFSVGQYTQVSMMLNSFGVQLECGAEPDPELVK